MSPSQESFFFEDPHSHELYPNRELVSDEQAPLEDPNPGHAVSINERNVALIESMDDWAEANRLEGLAKATKLPAHRQRLQQSHGNVDARAQSSEKKARELRSRSRQRFDDATGIKQLQEAGVEDIDGFDPQVMLTSFYINFREHILKHPQNLSRQRKKISHNIDIANRPND